MGYEGGPKEDLGVWGCGDQALNFTYTPPYAILYSWIRKPLGQRLVSQSILREMTCTQYTSSGVIQRLPTPHGL